MIEELKNEKIVLSDELLKLNKERKEAIFIKKSYVEKQQYENAAKWRNKEKEIQFKILNLLEEHGKYDFTKSQQMRNDIFKILDLIGDDDEDFSNAISKLDVIDYERMWLIKKIEQFVKEEISLEMLHKSIDKSLKSVRDASIVKQNN